MEYNRSSTKEKWTLMMYMGDFDLMATYAYALRASNNLSADNIDSILAQMEEEGVYRPRNGGSTFTGEFKSIQIAWYMFGYYNKARKRGEEKRLVFSPLGNLLLDNLTDKDKAARIFLAMLCGNGFRQPFSQMDERFNLYGFRLIFRLLRDTRLGGRLYDDEVFYYTMFLKTISAEDYEELVADILACRSRTPEEKYEEYKRHQKVVGLACHEWRYTARILQSAGILNFTEGLTIGDLVYGKINEKTKRPNAIRKYKDGYVELKRELIPLLDQLLENYPYDAKPYPEDELSSKFSNSLVAEMYSFYPPELLRELGMDSEEDEAIETMLRIANDVHLYARTETQSGENFERALAEAFNLFADVEAERIGGADNTDVECIYMPHDSPDIKFDIEAKATTRKLTSIHPRRIRAHREKIKSNYTLVATPNYSIGVLSDIADARQTAIVKSAVLSNYFYQSILKYGRELSYAALHDLVVANIGRDVSDAINAYVYSNFGHGAPDLKRKAN